jgi:hypothetical protein
MSTPRRTIVALAVWLALLGGTAASAQPLGTFRWQIQPYCNILSISVVQQGGVYLLNGTDDQCGASVQASVTGLAFQNPSGSIGFGLTVVTAPGGASIHIDATVNIATLNGAWRDSTGRAGTFIFTPGAGTGGTSREPPPPGFPVAAYAGGNQLVELTPADVVVRSVTLNAPVPGRVIINASGYFLFQSAVAADGARCSITTTEEVDFNRLIIAGESAVSSTTSLPFSGTRGLAVAGGPVAINLVCDEFTGDTSVGDTQLTAIFIPGGVLVAMDEQNR